MRLSNPAALIALLQQKALRNRTGLWLLAPQELSKEKELYARYNLDAIDIRTALLDTLPPTTSFLGLTSNSLLKLFDTISNSSSGTECIVIYNLDLLMAKLKMTERASVWNHLFKSFPNRRHALLLTMPAQADHLLPDLPTLELWGKDQRIATSPQNEI